MSARAIVFWGATGQARVLREALGDDGAKLIALFDNDANVASPFPDVPIHHGHDAFEAWLRAQPAPSELAIAVAIGGARGRDRVELQRMIARHGLQPLTIVHRTAFVAGDARVGAGSQLLAQSAVCAAATLGEACIVNTGATVDHECALGDGVHVCPGAHVAGCVEVGAYAMIGTGAAILPRVRIGAGAIVGAGAVVTRDVRAGATVVGNPARERQ